MSVTQVRLKSDGRAKMVPGPTGKPLLGWRGNMLPLLRDPIGYMQHLNRTYGDVVSLSEGSSEYLFVFSPEYNRQVLSDQTLFHNGAVNTPGSPVKLPKGSAAVRLFSGLTTMNDAKHTQQRRLLMPTFHKKSVETLHGTMVGLTEAQLAGWHIGQRFDLLREMKALTLSIAIQTILGLDPEREGDHVRRIMERWLKLTLSFSTVALPFNLPGFPFHRMLRLSQELENEIRAMLRRKRQLDRRGATAGGDALSMLIQAHDEDGTRLSESELIGQTTTLFVAGHETTANALTWTLFLLAQHPGVLEELQAEMEAKLHGEVPNIAQLADLPLLDRVIKESMRLLPPGLWFLRVTTAPTNFGSYQIEEGTRILWSPAVTHRRADIYPQPEKFQPQRWEQIDPSPYEYMPFGAGPRRCLGATFATMEMKLVLAMLLQRFSVQVEPRARIELGGSPLASPKYGMPVRLEARGERLRKARVRGNIGKFVQLN